MSNIVRMRQPDAPLPSYSDLEAELGRLKREVARLNRDHRRALQIEKPIAAGAGAVFASLIWIGVMWMTAP